MGLHSLLQLHLFFFTFFQNYISINCIHENLQILVRTWFFNYYQK
jgi:hypothetical protein